MPYHFLITKALPVAAILLIYWVGSFNLATVIFLPLALTIAFGTFYLTKIYGNKEEKEDIKIDGKKKK
jgi:hypothetical protein